MTTHRNLKPHYAEPKGKSGPVVVVKKGEIMSEPTTEAGRSLRDYARKEWRFDDDSGIPTRLIEEMVAAIEQEARANADRELRELLRDVMGLVRDEDQYGSSWDKALAASERKS